MRNILFLSLLLSLPFYASELSKTDASQNYKEDITKLNKDATKLYQYFKGLFTGLSGNPDVKPSKVFSFLKSGNRNFETIGCQFMSSRSYLEQFILPLQKELDEAFEEGYQATSNRHATWEWFIEHFKEEALDRSFADFQAQRKLEQ